MYRDEDYVKNNSAAGTTFVRSGNVLNSFINRVFGWMFIGLAATGTIGSILIGVGGACLVILVARWLFK